MARHRYLKWNRRSRNAEMCHRTRIACLGTAAGAALTFGMTPLTFVAPAHADLIDFFIDPIIDPLSGAGAAAISSLGDVGAASTDVSASVADVLGGLDSVLAALAQDLNTAVNDIAQGYLASPIGQTLDPVINAAATFLLGHDLIDTDGSAVSGTQTATGAEAALAYTVTSQWDGGFVADYTITNPGTAPLTNWKLEFDLPADDSIVSVWNAQLTQSGAQYVLTPESYDSTIAPDGSATIGFQVTDTGLYAPPTHVTIDGQPADTGTSGTTSTTGTTGTSTSTSTSSGGEFSPYFDVTLYPAFNYSSAADAGIKDATLAFIVADSQDQPAWGGFSAYAVDGGLDISYINNQISAMEADGISPTISFGGENGTYLADVPGQTVSGLENDYLEVINTYDIHKLDFDIEGAELSNTSALTLQAQALAAVEAQEAADGTPLTVSYTLPVLPTGLTASGLEPLELAKEYGVDVNVVNIMAMDYGGGFDGGGDPNMGELAIEAAQNTHSQLMQLYPDLSSAQAWSMVGVTPLIGINDDPAEIFTLADAQQLTDFAIQNHLGELSMWAGNKDVEGTLGATDQLDGSGIAQAPWAFSKIFEQFAE
jgi:hypothetical protein